MTKSTPKRPGCRRALTGTCILLVVIAAIGAWLYFTRTGNRALSFGAGLFINVEGAPIRFALPAPTGLLPVGVTDLHLIDEARPDPFVPDQPRELMISLWYPATETPGLQLAPYMKAAAAARFTAESVTSLGLPPEQIDTAGVRTHAWMNAPAEPGGPYPVLLFSPGGGQPRTLGTILAEDLASHGYVVVSIDHTHDASVVEFPDGRLEVHVDLDNDDVLQMMLKSRVDDMQFVLDRLAALHNGNNPDAGAAPLPAGLANALDLSRIGVYGHSAGGFAALQLLHEDSRVHAGVDMDGSLAFRMSKGIFGDVVNRGLDKPFMLLGAGLSGSGRPPHTHLHAPDWKLLWDNSRGWKRDVYLPEGEHFSFTDQQVILPQLDAKLGLPFWLRKGMIGTVDPEVAVDASRAYVLAFFEQHLRNVPQPLLEGNSPAHPFVDVID